MARDFAAVDTWIFDLDNTLYPPSCRLFDQIDVRMSAFVSAHLDLEPDVARALQKRLYHTHGTTLRGLMVEHGINPDGFLDYVHDIDYSPVQANADLDQALARLPGRCLVHTNGPRTHAMNVLRQLGITARFAGIFDILDADFIPKPAAEPYARLLKQLAVTPSSSAFFEDLAQNLAHPHALGMTTVLVTSPDGDPALHPQATEAHARGDIDYTTGNLVEFLNVLPLPSQS